MFHNLPTLPSKRSYFVAYALLICAVSWIFWLIWLLIPNTWIINRTGSVLLYVLSHAGYNTANSLPFLVPETELHGGVETVLLPIMTSIIVASEIFLLIITKGRLSRKFLWQCDRAFPLIEKV